MHWLFRFMAGALAVGSLIVGAVVLALGGPWTPRLLGVAMLAGFASLMTTAALTGRGITEDGPYVEENQDPNVEATRGGDSGKPTGQKEL